MTNVFKKPVAKIQRNVWDSANKSTKDYYKRNFTVKIIEKPNEVF